MKRGLARAGTMMGRATRGTSMAAETLLALWNDTPTRRAIVDFVQAVSTEGWPGFGASA